ncbi:MAG: phosphatase PAP2 family protein [Candidatus Micrarchaeota archaeon]
MFDLITETIVRMNLPILDTIAIFINNEIFFGLLILAIVFLGEKRNDKRLKIILTIIAGLIIAESIKFAYEVPRPCLKQFILSCPKDYSFPSSHATVVFILALSFINKRAYIFYLLFALFVSFTRVYLAVHTFYDVIGGLVIAAIVYYLVNLVIKNDRKD